ncbi:choice-of-anchor M domain-containing protein [Corynebacterium endometrii]|uniref:Surface-anchored protein n=1 Tax=Corynebacterium endometrii TaxID=2488819 RepID=A0A4V1CE99_9CORY|nr:choice-of-anchor M domain-containing protein [Corynebacterium endometrii]QCB27368.1 hypothetical protein CENDO_00290 [Corynebacterium endometrii]
MKRSAIRPASPIQRPQDPQSRTRIRGLALLTTAALTASVLTPAVAHAGPDDGKVVGTQKHIDAPKAYWTGDNFTLNALADTPLDDAVLWVGKGYNGGTGAQQYQYTLPDNDAFSDVGTPGQTYYAAPRNPGGNQDPIWWGYGADAGIPTDDFNQEAASMDLIAVEGPGEVEMFADNGDVSSLKRLLGTGESSPKSIKLSPGLHTHNTTLFTKPGRYVLTYRSTARGEDGNLIASEPQRLAVQVGGQKPLDAPTQSLQERYDAAPSGDAAAAGYSLSIQPKQSQDNSGDEHLSTIAFKADKPVSGTLTLLIDGYFLTDLPVVDGEATWHEFLGPLDSDIQAVFTPEATAKAAPRWISEPVHYRAGESVGTDSTTQADSWVDNTGTERALQSTEEAPLGAPGITTKLERVDDETLKFTVDAEDLNFNGFIEGGFYDAPEVTHATKPIEVNVRNGHGEALLSYNSWLEGYTVRYSVIPHPTYRATGSTVTLTESFDPLSPVENTSQLAALGTAAAEPQPEETAPDKCHDALVLDRGHIDIKATLDGDRFLTSVKDETGIHDSANVDRALSDVLIAVRDNALNERTAAMSDPELDFLGPVGERFYLLPQVQNRDIIWPGYNTQGLDYSKFKDEQVNLNLKPVSVPDGATWGMFLDKGLGEYQQLLNSVADDHTVETSFPAHAHANWAFSTPGTYTFEVTYSATTTEGETVTSEPENLTFAVGNLAVGDCAAPTEQPDSNPQQPQPETQPETQPQPESGSAKSPFAWLGPILGVAVIGAIVAFINASQGPNFNPVEELRRLFNIR